MVRKLNRLNLNVNLFQHIQQEEVCTNAYNAGMPPYDIMVMSGHKSEKVCYN